MATRCAINSSLFKELDEYVSKSSDDEVILISIEKNNTDMFIFLAKLKNYICGNGIWHQTYKLISKRRKKFNLYT